MKHWNLLAATSLIGLIAFCLAWELWLAPLHPGGSTLAVKALPLLAPLFGILRGSRYTHQWTSMLALAYLAEGLVRVWSDAAGTRWAPAVEIVLAGALFVACVAYARATAGGRDAPSVTPAD